MRDLVDPQLFVRDLERHITDSGIQTFLLTKSSVIDSSNFLEDFVDIYYFPFKDLDSLITLAICHWYFDKKIFYYAHLLLQERMNKLSLEDRFLLSQFIGSKPQMLLFLLEQRLWHSRQLYGNLLGTKMLKRLRHLDFKKKSRKVTQPIRKRGYNDKGTSKAKDKWLPSSDYTLTDQMNKREKDLDTLKDTILVSLIE